MNIFRILFCFIVVASNAFGQTSSPAVGSITVGGKATNLSYVLALQTKDWTLGANRKLVEVNVVKVILSDTPVEDVEDDFELGARGKLGNLNALRLVFGMKGDLMSGNIYHKNFEGGTSPVFMSHVLFDRKTLNDKTIAGKVRLDEPVDFGGPTYDFNITFSAAVQREPKPTVEGNTAAETAPAKAVQEFLSAVMAKDIATLKRILRKEFAEMLGNPEGQESVMALLDASYPADEVKQLKIVRLFDFGNRAWVEGTSKRSKSGGAPITVTYRIRTVRAGTGWKVQPM